MKRRTGEDPNQSWKSVDSQADQLTMVPRLPTDHRQTPMLPPSLSACTLEFRLALDGTSDSYLHQRGETTPSWETRPLNLPG